MKRGQTAFLITFLVLPLALFGIFVVSPYVQAFYLGMTDWTGYSETFNIVGLQNFAYIFGFEGVADAVFWRGLRNNLVLLVTVPVITIVIALFFASMLNLSGSTKGGQIKGVPGSGFFRILFFVPQVISVAALGILFQQLFQPNGLLNSLIRLVAPGSNPPAWLVDTRFALACVVVVLVWMNVGFYMVYFTAAMASIPRELLEAAAIDRAGKLATFMRITLPLLWPSVQTAFIYIAILSLDALAIVQVMTVGPGGPDSATTVMALSLFLSKQEGYFGYASAQGVIIFLITLVLAALTFRITRREQVEL
ncbi:carbohydrate ABC transporter permease [Propionibacteriaceae bacterium Y2011]|uniref:carbohydrate ABC transporter permease n=1 Tax=Microlunatus sp. Y2014 TaxID=3418488 RepID=UPI003B47EDDE